MKKNLIITTLTIILLSILIIPNNVSAKTEVTGLDEAVSEEIETFKNESSYADAVAELESYDLSGYKDDDKKINVYLFRGGTCSHCFDAILHFASIYDKEGKYFNVKTYEVWNNTDNNELMEKVADKLGDKVDGVPYIVVGNKSWSGYADSYDDEILSKIKSEYNKKASERTDVINNVTNGKNDSNIGKDILAVLIIIFVVIAIVFGIVMTRKEATE